MRSRALFGTFSRALFVVHGQKIWKCSRALFAVHGHFFLKSSKNSGICVFTGTFRRFTGTFFCKCSRALLRFTGTFEIHGHFFGFTGKIFFKSSRATSRCSRALLRNCSRALFQCSRKKKPWISALIFFPKNFKPISFIKLIDISIF